MVVCKFFVEGRCKYGDNCRFDHPRGGGSSRGVTFHDSFGAATLTQRNQNLFQHTQSPFRWTSNQQQQSQQQGGSTSQDILKNLPVEMELWHKSGMWPFSCYALEKDIPSLPDFKDISPEEVRLDAYNARDSGTFESFKQKVAMLTEEYRKIQEHMRHLSPQLQQTLVQWIEEGRNQKAANSSSHSLVKPLFGGQAAVATQQVISASSGSLFGGSAFSASLTLSAPGFGGSGAASSVFGGIKQSDGASSVFSQNQPSSGYFCQNAANQATAAGGTVFGQTNIFGTSNQPSGLFVLPGTAALNPPTGLFAQLGSQSSINSQVGLFGQPMAATDTNSPVGNTSQTAGLSGPGVFSSGVSAVGLFGKPATSSSILSPVFGGTRTAGIGLFGGGSTGGAQNDASLYTPLADLTSDEKQQFQAKMFTLGKIPMKPPPLELINI